jgi:hypothetical protein
MRAEVGRKEKKDNPTGEAQIIENLSTKGCLRKGD